MMMGGLTNNGMDSFAFVSSRRQSTHLTCCMMMLLLFVCCCGFGFGIVAQPAMSYVVSVPLHRNGMGEFLEDMQAKRGAEIGVQNGRFSAHVLTDWASCEYFLLVDPWLQQNVTYTDFANTDDFKQEYNYQNTVKRLSIFSNILDVKRMTSKDASVLVPDDSLDFVYLDARHDYCSVKEDLELWWPKLKMGGILAGHDFVNQDDLDRLDNLVIDWTLCPDGVTRNRGLVKGAVLEFAQLYNLGVHQTYEAQRAQSFLLQKPMQYKSEDSKQQTSIAVDNNDDDNEKETNQLLEKKTSTEL